ncbi:MAG: HAMP domain-containing histidine kinase [Melioribacteraceae bacterium]|nr:HAMP domain-containing histidine kinase [Melioribacteraceae bacterium]
MREILNLDSKSEFEKFTKEVEELRDIWNSYQELLLSYKASEEEVKRKNEELKEANETKDILFSIISHDLRSPFQGLLGISNYLLDEFNSLTNDEIKELIQSLNDGLKNQYKFLDDLLNWSRLQSGKLQVERSDFNLFELVEKVKELFINNLNAKKILFVNNLRREKIINADEDLIYILIRNLISNSIKFTNENGKVEVNSISFEDFVQISISDNGVGIKQENIDKIFKVENHFTTRGTHNEKGNGFGLALCKEIVLKHNGKIWLKSEFGKGTTFFFTIPHKIEL